MQHAGSTGAGGATNSSCGACRVAKVKCVHEEDIPSGRCTRCHRLGLDCVVEKRRSKWDRSRSVRPQGTPVEILTNPVYDRVLADLDKLRPIVDTQLMPHLYEKQVGPCIAHFFQLAIENDDAAAFACAASQIQKFRLRPSSFLDVIASCRRVRPQIDVANTHLNISTSQPYRANNGVHAQRTLCAPPDLPLHLAGHFAGDLQAMAMISRDGIRRFYLNQYCNVDVERLGSAVGPQETGMALGLTGNDALRLFDRIASNGARLMQKASMEPRPTGHDVELPPILLRFPETRDPTAPHIEPKLRLHVLRTAMHASGDGSMMSMHRWVPLSRSCQRKRKADVEAAGELLDGIPDDVEGIMSSSSDSSRPLADLGEGGYDLGTLLDEVGGDEALMRELIDATR